MKLARDSAKFDGDRHPRVIFAAELGTHSALIDLIRRRGHKVIAESRKEGLLRQLRLQQTAGVMIDLDNFTVGRWALLQELRERTRSPIVVLLSSVDDKIEMAALKHGADLVIRMKCSPELIMQRFISLLRLCHLSSPESDLEHVPLRNGYLEVDVNRVRVTWKGEHVSLSKTEFEFVQFLAERPGYLRTREQIQDRLYGANNSVFERTIDGHVKRIRQKFKQIDSSFDRIQTLYGLGYRLMEETRG